MHAVWRENTLSQPLGWTENLYLDDVCISVTFLLWCILHYYDLIKKLFKSVMDHNLHHSEMFWITTTNGHLESKAKSTRLHVSYWHISFMTVITKIFFICIKNTKLFVPKSPCAEFEIWRKAVVSSGDVQKRVDVYKQRPQCFLNDVAW